MKEKDVQFMISNTSKKQASVCTNIEHSGLIEQIMQNMRPRDGGWIVCPETKTECGEKPGCYHYVLDSVWWREYNGEKGTP